MTAVLRIFESELEVLATEIRAWPDTETGGSLYGLWSVGGSPTVMLACRPGPNAVHEEAYFVQDPATHMALERALWERFGVQCVGLWHSHHRIGLPHLSGGDVQRTRTYARKHGRDRYTEILGWYDEHGQVAFRPYVYAQASDGLALDARVEVLPGTSPLRASLGTLPKAAELGRSLAPGTGPRRRYSLHASTSGDLTLRRTKAERVMDALGDLIGECLPPTLHDGLELWTEADDRVILTVSGPARKGVVRLALTWEGTMAVDRFEVRATPDGRLVTASAPAGARRHDVRGALGHGVRVLRTLDPGA